MLMICLLYPVRATEVCRKLIITICQQTKCAEFSAGHVPTRCLRVLDLCQSRTFVWSGSQGLDTGTSAPRSLQARLPPRLHLDNSNFFPWTCSPDLLLGRCASFLPRCLCCSQGIRFPAKISGVRAELTWVYRKRHDTQEYSAGAGGTSGAPCGSQLPPTTLCKM